MDVDYQRYRREQEEAVSNQTGSTAVEVFFALIPNACSIFLALTCITLIGPQINQQTRTIIEFFVTVVPCILYVTVLADKTVAICQILLIIGAANILLILGLRPRDSFRSFPGHSPSRIPSLTNFRAMTNIIAVVCILAVDFKCFPRKFVKTETYGYSLMDTGVGFFVISNALVAPEARYLDATAATTTFLQNLAKTLKGCVPLLVLGFGRFASIEILDYQRHVSEYGVHWNFFLTLACVKLFTEVLSQSLRSRYALVTGLWILGMHEYTLSTRGLKEWVLGDDPRDDFLSANREGWVSIPGYVGLYLIGIALGRLIHATYQKSDCQLVFDFKISTFEFQLGYTRTMALTFKFYVISNIAFVATYYCEQYFNVSRRLANSGYCAWMLTLSSLAITLLLMIDVLLECITGCVREKTRRRFAKNLRRDDLNAKEEINIVKTLEIFEAVNDNGMLFFLFANVMTGIINMSMKTLRVEESRAVAIIIAYMIGNITLVLLRYRGKRLLNAKKKV